VNVHTVLWWVIWIKETEAGGAELYDKVWSGCPCTAVSYDIYCVHELTCGNCFNIFISKGIVVAVIEQLDCAGVCANWEPQV